MAYTSQALLIARWGLTNITSWSDVDEAGSLNSSRITEAIESARQEIDQTLVILYNVPFSDTVPPTIQEIANNLAAWYLYSVRGLRDNSTDQKMAGSRALAERLLTKLGRGDPLIDSTSNVMSKVSRQMPIVTEPIDIPW